MAPAIRFIISTHVRTLTALKKQQTIFK